MRYETDPPTLDFDNATHLRLAGSWTLAYAEDIGERLREAPDTIESVDATTVDRLDSAGVLQLLRFARRRGLDFSVFRFREDHAALVAAIEDVADDRPKKKREYGVAAALERLGFTVYDNWKEIVLLVGFLGENLIKFGRMVLQPRRFRLTSKVYHMERVGLDVMTQ